MTRSAESDGGGEAGGVFVDVKRAVEVGNAEAFERRAPSSITNSGPK